MIRASVSKTFKRMLTQNYQRGINLNSTYGDKWHLNQNPTEKGPESTQSAFSKGRLEGIEMTSFNMGSINPEIENKYARRSKINKSLHKKAFKEDTMSYNSPYIKEQYEHSMKGNVYKVPRKQEEMKIL